MAVLIALISWAHRVIEGPAEVVVGVDEAWAQDEARADKARGVVVYLSFAVTAHTEQLAVG
jgi:hypothetical protein